MIICNYLTLIISTYFIIILIFWIIWLILFIWIIWLILIICKEIDYLIIVWNWLFVIIWQRLFVIIWFWLFDHYLNYLNYLTYLSYSTYFTYLTYLILFDLESSHYSSLTGRAAKFLMENDMETASLENERLRTQLKECQDALAMGLSCRKLCLSLKAISPRSWPNTGQ